jgi:hypothetical protein
MVMLVVMMVMMRFHDDSDDNGNNNRKKNTKFKVNGSAHLNSILIYIQKDAKLHSLFCL